MESDGVTATGGARAGRTASLPLAGGRVVLTRPRDQAGNFEARVRTLGGVPVLAPAIAIAPPPSWEAADRALARLDDYDWVAFTSANAVRALTARAWQLGLDPAVIGRRRIAAVGPATASALTAAIRAPDIIASIYGAQALAGEIPIARGERLLFPCGVLARDALPLMLRDRGVIVDDVLAYRTVAGDGLPVVVGALRDASADAVMFASPSAVTFVAGALSKRIRAAGNAVDPRVGIFCLGPTTEAAARAAGFRPAATARAATQDELIDEVARWFALTPNARSTEG